MPPGTPIRVTLELEPRADPVGGLVLDPRCASGAFSGWMELTRRIELAVAVAAPEPPPAPVQLDSP